MHKTYLREIGRRLDYVKKAEHELKRNGIKRDNYEQTERILKQVKEHLWPISQSKRIIKYQKSQRMEVPGNIRNINVTISRKRFKV